MFLDAFVLDWTLAEDCKIVSVSTITLLFDFID